MVRSLPLRVLDLATDRTVSFIEPGGAIYGTSDGFAGLRLVRFHAAAGRRYAMRLEVEKERVGVQAARAKIVVMAPPGVSKRDDFRVAFGELKIAAGGLAVAISGGMIGLAQILRIRRRSR